MKQTVNFEFIVNFDVLTDSVQKMKVKLVFLWFLGGFVIGYITDQLTTEQLTYKELKIGEFFTYSEKNVSHLMQTKFENVKKLRIMCCVHTNPESHSKRAVHVKETWGKNCDKILFASTLTDNNLGAIGFNVTDAHSNTWGKSKLMWQYVYQNFINQYDWFIKADDDTFLLVDNLKFLLAEYSTDDPIVFGYRFNDTVMKNGYVQGGAGYAMSRQSIRTFVEKTITEKAGFKRGSCALGTDRRNEDVEISWCLSYHSKVYFGDARDLLKRERFLMLDPERHLHNGPNVKENWWYTKKKWYWSDEGLDCCSNYTISFHYIYPKYQYTMMYLTYRLQPYGIKRRFPSQPKKRNFTEVVNILNLEKMNKSLRGY